MTITDVCSIQCISMCTLFFFRLESIAVDAELQEKSLLELERLADILHESCAQAESEHMLRYIHNKLVILITFS